MRSVFILDTVFVPQLYTSKQLVSISAIATEALSTSIKFKYQNSREKLLQFYIYNKQLSCKWFTEDQLPIQWVPGSFPGGKEARV
jgi:hypothetical protein